MAPKTSSLERLMQSPNTATILKSYESPTLKKLEPEEAKKFLVHHVNMGDSGAKEVLVLVLPPDENRGH